MAGTRPVAGRKPRKLVDRIKFPSPPLYTTPKRIVNVTSIEKIYVTVLCTVNECTSSPSWGQKTTLALAGPPPLL
jgi:hypothetical protein